MDKSFRKLGGYCLMIGTVLMILTMVLHPAGSNLQSILKIYNIAIISHSIAVLSIPFILFGFWCLAQYLETPNKLSYLVFIVMMLSFICVAFAAILNGLLLPLYVHRVQQQILQNENTIKLITQYGITLNAALTYTFITGFSLAILIWSYLIHITRRLPFWFVCLAILLIIMLIVMIVSKINLVSVYGFRLYVFGIAFWIVSAGGFLVHKNQ
jgi:hypothetical protein